MHHSMVHIMDFECLSRQALAAWLATGVNRRKAELLISLFPFSPLAPPRGNFTTVANLCCNTLIMEPTIRAIRSRMKAPYEMISCSDWRCLPYRAGGVRAGPEVQHVLHADAASPPTNGFAVVRKRSNFVVRHLRYQPLRIEQPSSLGI